MKLLVDWLPSPVRLILELPKRPQLPLFREYCLDGHGTKRADQLIFEISNANEKAK